MGTLLQANNDNAIGFCLYRMDSSVTPSSGASWVASSPQTVNNVMQVTNSTSDEFSQTITIGVGPDGPGGGASASESVTLTHSISMDVTDWAVVETSDPGTNQCSWKRYQNVPWSGANIPQDNFIWWQGAYDCGGGHDVVWKPNNLSSTTMQYHNTAGWRFDGSLVQNGTLPVTFNGGATYYLDFIANPEYFSNGHHMINFYNPTNNWNCSMDLVALAQG